MLLYIDSLVSLISAVKMHILFGIRDLTKQSLAYYPTVMIASSSVAMNSNYTIGSNSMLTVKMFIQAV